MLKVGIIGLGAIADIHIQAIQNIPYAKIISVCDIDEKVLNLKSTELSANAYNDYKTMLDSESLDIVHICTPHYLHTQMAVSALNHDCNVYLEKPVGMFYSESQLIQDAEENSNKIVCVSLQNRYNETSKMAKKIIDSGELGKVVGIKADIAWRRTGEYYTKSDWRGCWDKEGGALLMNQAIHTLDLMNYFSNSLPNEVNAHIANWGNKNIMQEEDTAQAYIKYNNGIVGIFFGTIANTKNDRVYIDINLEKGSLALFHDKLYQFDENGEKIVASDEIMQGEKSYWGIGHKYLIADFYKYLSRQGGGYIPLSEGRNVLKLCDMIYNASNFNGQNKK